MNVGDKVRATKDLDGWAQTAVPKDAVGFLTGIARFGKAKKGSPPKRRTRSRVPGWTTRALSAKPVKKLPPAGRLAGLFLAAHSTSKLLGRIPPDLPDACRTALPDLLRKGFLTELSEDRCRLDPAVRHLSGMRQPSEEERAAKLSKDEGKAVAPASTPGFQFDADAWTQWKSAVTPVLRRHVELQAVVDVRDVQAEVADTAITALVALARMRPDAAEYFAGQIAEKSSRFLPQQPAFDDAVSAELP